MGIVSIFATSLSVFLVAGLIHLSKSGSIASVRRILALSLVGTFLWLLIFLLGLGVSFVSGNAYPRINTLVIGGFTALSFEFIAINGVILESTKESLGLASLHPLSLLIPLASAMDLTDWHQSLSLLVGATFLFLALLFVAKMKHLKTTKHHITSLQLLQAFLKTWVSHDSEELEGYFRQYSKLEEVTTEVMEFKQSGAKVLLILPGIHAGPFYPVGSYNLSELLYQKTKASHTYPAVLHGMGGHERNLPMNAYANSYTDEVSTFVPSVDQNKATKYMRGPFQRRVGGANLTAMAFGNQALLFVSKAPYNSDDLDPTIVGTALQASKEAGIELALVDAHNCIGGEDGPPITITGEDWRRFFQELMSFQEQKFSLGYAHSSETGFTPRADISDGGIELLVFETGTRMKALVICDSNNARTGLREDVASILAKKDIELIELCTSDTHNLAARNLTSRGYFALGEDTGVDEIVDLVARLADVAKTRVDSSECTFAGLRSDLPLIGTESLDDFALITKEAITMTKDYLKKVMPLAAALLFVVLLY